MNARMQGDVTPLHLAAANGKTNVMEILIKNGADIGAKTDQGNTPLHTNAANGNLFLFNQNGLKSLFN